MLLVFLVLFIDVEHEVYRISTPFDPFDVDRCPNYECLQEVVRTVPLVRNSPFDEFVIVALANSREDSPISAVGNYFDQFVNRKRQTNPSVPAMNLMMK